MTRLWLFAPFAALLVLTGYVGLKMGQPVRGTAIIAQIAGMYVAEQGNGAKASDCSATPDLRAQVRLVVRCAHPSGAVHLYYSGPRGQLRDLHELQEPQA